MIYVLSADKGQSDGGDCGVDNKQFKTDLPPTEPIFAVLLEDVA